MGLHDIPELDESASQAFKEALLNDLDALQIMLERGLIEDGAGRIGAEQEMFLVDSALRPAPVAEQVLARLDHPQFTTEMGKFNLELNLMPRVFGGGCLHAMESELDSLIGRARGAAAECGATILLSGTLPTAHQYHLSLENLVPSPRYLQLNRVMTKLRGPSYPIQIQGIDELQIVHDNVMPEACCSSFQVHFQVSPATFAPVYNMAQMVAAPVLAAAVNSPLLLGQRLWQETRIALFQHSVDERSPTGLVRGDPPRVSFGEAWVRQSALEIFREEVARFRVIMTAPAGEDSCKVLERGEIPELAALRLHNGTVWRWNRPCYGVMDGRAHLRIEARAMPAGPSILDEMANAAFLFGLLVGMTGEYGDIRNIFPFHYAKENFFLAARYGLGAHFQWIGGRRIPATQLIREELLPIARVGLRQSGIEEADIDRYLDTIDRRVLCEQTGSQWALESLSAMGNLGSREARQRCLTGAMVRNQLTGDPVHLWPLAEADLTVHTVEDCMTTDLFTVRPDDLIRLAANMMAWRNIGHVPVEDDEGRLVGLVSQRMLIKLIDARFLDPSSETTLVREIMLANPPVTSPECPLLQVIEEMRTHATDCLPVVVGERLVGIVTSHDLLWTLARLYQGRPHANVAGQA